MNTLPTQLIRIYGVVQGVGFRPFVSRTADRLALRGSVANKGSFVEVHAQGSEESLKRFRLALDREAPPRSTILEIIVKEISEPEYTSFEIIESEKETGDILVSPDIATCDLCAKELFDPSNRRYLHPFINCTACGPRLTILDSMPYDRERTSMGEFPMCPDCEFEYSHAETRRYDAQPVCCNECGPHVYLVNRPERGREAITETRKAILSGKIAAIKGIGGFHLCCNARDEEAVKRLRTLKHRPAKPFALMMRDVAAVRKECEVPPSEAEILTGHQKPVVLLRKKKESTLPEILAPGNPTLGVMLPYAPVQMLLFQFDDGLVMPDCLVMTSGNVSGAPICRNDEDALLEISSFCDLILSHNRKIRLRADDSVMDFFEGKPYMIRRSRGYAPLPFMLSRELRGHVLGIGGELKNTFCLGADSLFYPSPYLGDMEDLRTVNALRESIRRMEELLEIRPTLIACDLHPKYNTVRVAEELNLPLLRIQHHYAHILSCMAENDVTDRVIGVSFDGTGYGTDGTIQGGEFLLCDFDAFQRIGSIAPFIQTGGDASARDGWRIAASLLHSLFPSDAPAVASELNLCTEQEFRIQAVMSDRRVNSVLSTSAGRLFDAASALLGLKRHSTFEGEAAMALQFAAESAQNAPETLDVNPLLIRSDRNFTLNTGELFRQLVRAIRSGADARIPAWEFHRILADMIAAGCVRARELSHVNLCALSGGVFQNRLLTRETANRLRKEGFRVLLHSLVPPNDGGLCLGQAAAAMYHLNRKQ